MGEGIVGGGCFHLYAAVPVVLGGDVFEGVASAGGNVEAPRGMARGNIYQAVGKRAALQGDSAACTIIDFVVDEGVA